MFDTTVFVRIDHRLDFFPASDVAGVEKALTKMGWTPAPQASGIYVKDGRDGEFHNAIIMSGPLRRVPTVNAYVN